MSVKENVEIENELEKQLLLSEWIDKSFKIEFPADHRNLIALSCFDLVIEHHSAIIFLCRNQLYGSMFALYRIVFEALVRGMYISYCATEEDLKRFQKGETPKFGDMVKSIEGSLKTPSTPLSQLKTHSYTIMNDFTHTGYQHLVRRNSNGKTGQMSYPDDEKMGVLRSSGSFVLLAASVLSELSKRRDLQQEVLKKSKIYAG